VTYKRLIVGVSLGLGLALSGVVDGSQRWRMQPLEIPTRWAASISPSNALPEYPRPQMTRGQWQNLNGLWDYAITSNDARRPDRYDGTILVPYPLESALSGVQRSLQPDQLLWYRRTFTLRPTAVGKRTLLHFGSVDYRATVFINGLEIGTHNGGYQPFTFDITNALQLGTNELIVKVYDPTDAGPNPHGKQTLHPQGIQYTASSGIWKTVWLENVPKTYIEDLKMTPDVDGSQLNIEVGLQGQTESYRIEVVAKSGSTVVARKIVSGPTALHILRPHLWSTGDPFLYDLDVRLLKGRQVIDEVQSYFGMRKIETKKDSAGIDRIFLNGQYTYNLGVLDQGFWPDGLYTAPADAALKFDVQAVKAMGFNTIRKHLKVEPDRWYYYCDKLGILVWQDMPASNNDTPEARTEFETEVKENLAQLHNHPSIIAWGLFNEGWGAYDQERLARWMKELDPSRLLNGHSGPFGSYRLAEWERHRSPAQLFHETVGGGTEEYLDELQSREDNEPANWASNMSDLHHYSNPTMPPAKPGKVRVLGETGGIGVVIDGHTWKDISGFGYEDDTPGQLAQTYSKIVETLKSLETQGLAGSMYTELSDIEGEQNGLLTYDRTIGKIPVGTIAKINAQLVPTPANYAVATRGFTVESVDSTPDNQRLVSLTAQYRAGERQPSFLKTLAVLADRENDQPLAAEVRDELVRRLPQPYSADSWSLLLATTRTSKDEGFTILLARCGEADSVLGMNVAETALRKIIFREEIPPYDSTNAPDWQAIEKTATAKYGQLGAEEVHGAEMMYYLGKSDWNRFGDYYARYFATAVTRSEYPVASLSYKMFEYVTDPAALEAAIRTLKSSIDTDGSAGHAVELDTYAGLLYKAGHKQEALQWQEKAMKLAQGGDTELVANFKKMKAGEPTWN